MPCIEDAGERFGRDVGAVICRGTRQLRLLLDFDKARLRPDSVGPPLHGLVTSANR
jgi:hypothetical protein